MQGAFIQFLQVGYRSLLVPSEQGHLGPNRWRDNLHESLTVPVSALSASSW